VTGLTGEASQRRRRRSRRERLPAGRPVPAARSRFAIGPGRTRDDGEIEPQD